MSSLSFDSPRRLLLLAVVAALIAIYVAVQLQRGRTARRWADDALQGSTGARSRSGVRHLSATLLALSLVAMTAAFAGPRQEREVQRDRATIVVALDTSSSMLAQDVAPDRFTAAKAAATSFVETLPARFDVALVSFHGTATLAVPATRDHAEVTRAISGLELSGGTALGDALNTSLSALATPEAESVGAIVLLADGGSTVGSPLPTAVQRAKDTEVPVNTIAYGTPDGVVVADGRTFQVPVDVQTLADVADQTGGRHFTAASAGELKSVYDDLRTRLSTTVVQQDVSAPLAGLGLLLLFAGVTPGLLRR